MLDQFLEFTFWQWVAISYAALGTIMYAAFLYFSRNDFPVYRTRSANDSTRSDGRLKGLKSLIFINLLLVISAISLLYFSYLNIASNPPINNAVKIQTDSTQHKPAHVFRNGRYEDVNMWE